CVLRLLFLEGDSRWIDARRRARDSLDNAYGAAMRASQKRLCRARHHLRWDGDDLPDRLRTHARPTPEILGSGPDRVRLGFAVVRRAAVAGGGILALPDPGRDVSQVRLSSAHWGDEAQDIGPQFCAPLQARTQSAGRRRRAV